MEALHDVEATADTLGRRAADLRGLGVNLPKNVNMIVGRRELEAKICNGEFIEFFDFLNPDKAADIPNGICAVMNTENPRRDDPELVDFQVDSLLQAVNSMLLTCWKDPALEGCDSTSSDACKQSVGAETASKEEMSAKTRRALDVSLGRIAKFFQIYSESFLSTNVANCKNALLQDDLRRLGTLVSSATSDQELSLDDCDVVGGHRSAMIENKTGSFHRSLTLFPVGIYLMETIAEEINRVKKEQLLQLDLATAANIAQELKPMTVDTLLKAKDKGGQGELEVSVPNSSKVIEMTTKWLAASEGSATFLSQNQERLHAVEQKVLELKSGFLGVVSTKTREYEKVDGFLSNLCSQKGLSQDDVAEMQRSLIQPRCMSTFAQACLIKIHWQIALSGTRSLHVQFMEGIYVLVARLSDPRQVDNSSRQRGWHPTPADHRPVHVAARRHHDRELEKDCTVVQYRSTGHTGVLREQCEGLGRILRNHFPAIYLRLAPVRAQLRGDLQQRHELRRGCR